MPMPNGGGGPLPCPPFVPKKVLQMKTYFLVVTEDCYIVPANGPVERDINYRLDFYQLGMPSPMATNQGTVWEHLSGDLPISGADSPSSGPSGTFYDTQSVVLGTSAQSLTQTFSVVLNSGTNVGLAVYAFGGWQYELSIKKYPGYVSINSDTGGTVNSATGKLVSGRYKSCK